MLLQFKNFMGLPTEEITIDIEEIKMFKINERKCGTSIFGKRCWKHSPTNGIEHIAVYSGEHVITVLKFLFTGPDTHSDSIPTLCQYGGLWILTSDDKHFKSSHQLVQFCWNNFDMTEPMTMTTDKKYIAIITVQYNGISSSFLEYQPDKQRKIGKIKTFHHVRPHSELSPNIGSFDEAYITSENISTLKNVSLIFNRNWKNIYPYKIHIDLKLYVPYEKCSCRIRFQHILHEKLICMWCEERRLKVPSKTELSIFNRYSTVIPNAIDMQINCMQCFTKGLFSLHYEFDDSNIETKTHGIRPISIPNIHDAWFDTIYSPKKLYLWMRFVFNKMLILTVTAGNDLTDGSTLNVSFIECNNYILSNALFILTKSESMTYIPYQNNRALLLHLQTDREHSFPIPQLAKITFDVSKESHIQYFQLHDTR